MYKVEDWVLKDSIDSISKLLEELWLNSELTPEEFQELKVVKKANKIMTIIKDNYGV